MICAHNYIYIMSLLEYMKSILKYLELYPKSNLVYP